MDETLEPSDILVDTLVDPPSDTQIDPQQSDTPIDPPQSDTPFDPPSNTPIHLPSDKPVDKKVKNNHLDKFKRRLIRSVARMLITEKLDPAMMWKTMKKETGRDCKTIWDHMRALTLRKLSRLLAADDYVTRVGEIARMSPVDWLQFDLVLVHEDIDVWDLGTASNKCLSNLSAPWELLQLAHQHDVIQCSGQQLALTWATITVHYNRKGRQCSPMLLQKRWHQLLQQTRDMFYVFWYEYRGTESKISQAKEKAPSPLEYTVAKCYPMIITKKFPKWTEALQDGQHRIVLVNELQQVMRDKQREKTTEDGPELVLMEPEIDTIEIGDDSDEEIVDKAHETDTEAPNEDNSKIDDENPAAPKIKEEPPYEHIENLDPDEDDDGLSNVKIVTATHLTTEEIIDNDVAQLDLIDRYAQKNVLDVNSINDDDMKCVVLSSDITEEIAPLVDLETNTSELLTESPESTANKLDLVTADLKQPTIIADDRNMTEFNTNKMDLDTSKGDITNEPEINKESCSASILAESLISPEHLFEGQQELGDQKTTMITSDDTDINLNAHKTDINLPDANIIKKEPTFAKHEPLIETIESSDYNFNTNNICISETRSLNHEHLNDNACSEVLDIMVKIGHAKQAQEENAMSEVNTVCSEIINQEQINKKLAKSDLSDVTIAMDNTASNRNIDPDLIYTRTLTDTVTIDNKYLQTSDIEEDMIMYEPTLNVNNDKTLENITSTNDVKITVIQDDDSELMEIVDDGIDDGEYLIDDECLADSTTHPQETSGNSDEMPAKIDLKLIMDAIVFTTKLDDMKSLNNRSFEEVKSDVLINKVLEESKPVRLKNKDNAVLNVNNSATGEKANICITNQNNNTSDKILIIDENQATKVHIKMEVDHNEDETAESNNVQYSEMDSCQDDQESSEDEYEDVRINPNSKVFKKPNNLSYNPVQLCKNPDFNTRLKRIPILFYTYQSNKEYLKECKPLTIDLDKGFERKMYNNTIYLKRDPNAVRLKEDPKIHNTITKTKNIHEANKQLDSVELTVTQDQGNEVQVKLESILDFSNEELILERKRKLINLHDIVKVRRINQQLLTAEISPILKCESDNSNSYGTIDLTYKPDTLPDAEMNVVNEEQADPKVLIPEKPTETNTAPIIEQPITQPAKLAKSKVAPKHPNTPWYLKKTPYGRPVEKIPVPSNETVENRVRRIYGDSLLTGDAVNKMLLILETDALANEHVKKFFSSSCKAVPNEDKIKFKKKKRSLGVGDQNMNKDDLDSENIDDDEEKKMQKLEDMRLRDLEKRKLKREKEKRRDKLRQKKIEKIQVEISEVEKEIITNQFNTYSDENKSAQQKLNAQKKKTEVKCKMLCRTQVHCHSTPGYLLRGFDNVPKMTVFSDCGIVKKGVKSGAMSFLVPANPKKKLSMSPIILRNFGVSTESVKPSSVPLSRENVKLNITPKDIFLSAKFLSMFPENSSFGKDKIILTTANLDCFVKINEPSPLKSTPAPIVHSDSQQLFPPFEVPEGVRFYLTTTGDVVGTVDAGITDPNVANSIPTYVTAIKDILLSVNTSKETATAPVSTELDITQCKTTENSAGTESAAYTIDITQSENDENLKTADSLTSSVELTQSATKTSEVMATTALIASSSEIDQCMNADELKATATTKNTKLIEISRNEDNLQEPSNSASLQGSDSTSSDIIEKNKSGLEPTYNNDSEDHSESNSGPKKSILSDLMEMTGITSEDIMTSKPEVLEIPAETVIPITNIIPVTPLVEQPLAHYFSDLRSEDTNPNLKHLTPVTSFEMLKYANTKNAEFYKLDLITGVILPITVGFKRVKTFAKRNNIRTVQMHSTIDLTEDGDDDSILENSSIAPIKTHVIRNSDLQRSRLTDDDDELLATHAYKQQPRSRKQKLQPRSYETKNTDGVVSLSEFDEAVEQVHLDDSNGSQTDTELEDETGDEFDDDSVEPLSSDDDEPLSSVISRRNSKDKNASYAVAIKRHGRSSIIKRKTDAQGESTSMNEDAEAGFEFNAGLRAGIISDDVDESMSESDADSSTNGGSSDDGFILGV